MRVYVGLASTVHDPAIAFVDEGGEPLFVEAVERDWRSPSRKEADLTFRMLVIIKHQWERQMRMLDRRDDGYPV